MTPIVIKESILNMTNKQLSDKLYFKAYSFCVTADFSKPKTVKNLISSLEMYVMEGLLRVLESELGYIPFQNKIYENVEEVFSDQDAYNINRMMSSLRRMKVLPIDPTNEKYIGWVRNRVKYSVRSLISMIMYLEYISDKSVQTSM